MTTNLGQSRRFHAVFWSAVLAFLVAIAVGAAGCGMQEPYDDELPTEGIDCIGKCDWMKDLTRLVKNWDEVDVGDLLTLGAGFATPELNNAMVFGDLGFAFEAPEHFGLEANAVGTVNNLDVLVSGLAARFGERDLSTRVNRIRRDWLEDERNDDTLYSEAAFKVRATNLGKTWSWNHEAKGLDLDFVVYVGFKAGVEVQSRVIAAFKDKIEGTGRSMLEALMQTRGFVYPNTLDDLQGMKPGEMYARRGKGNLAINIGVGVPLLVLEPISNLTYTIVLTAVVGTGISGTLDIQAIRLEEDELVLDVGIDLVGNWGGRVNIHGSWGAVGLFQRTIEIAGKVVDLGDMAEDALLKQLNKKLDLLRIHAELSATGSRLSMAQLRFRLDADSEHLEEALAQALRGDVRLAQALSAKGDSGVKAVYDVSRSGISTTSGAGIDIFGMSFFFKRISQDGSVVIQEPGGARALLFESLEREGGGFVSEHGHTRMGLAGLLFTESEDPERAGLIDVFGEANLFVQIKESDYFMQRDKIADHLDGLILGYTGWEVFEKISLEGNDLEDDMKETFGDCTSRRYRACKEDDPFNDNECDRSDYQDVCWTETLVDGAFPACVTREAQACLAQPGNKKNDCARWTFWEACLGEFPEDHRIAQAYQNMLELMQHDLGHLARDERAIVGDALDLRLATQSMRELPPGPPIEMRLSTRLDEGALTDIMTTANREQVKNAIFDYIVAQKIDREDEDREKEIRSYRNEVWGKIGRPVLEIADRFAEAQAEYVRLQQYEYANLRTLGNIGSQALRVRLEPDGASAKTYKALAAESHAWARAQLMTELYDDIVSLGHRVEYCRQRSYGDSDTETCFDYLDHEEQLAFYLLLRLNEPAMSEVRLHIDMDLEDNFWTGSGWMEHFEQAGYRNTQVYSRGEHVSPIDGGLFDIDNLPHPILELTD